MGAPPRHGVHPRGHAHLLQLQGEYDFISCESAIDTSFRAPSDLQGHKTAAAAAEAERGEPGHPQPPGKVSLEFDTIRF